MYFWRKSGPYRGGSGIELWWPLLQLRRLLVCLHTALSQSSIALMGVAMSKVGLTSL